MPAAWRSEMWGEVGCVGCAQNPGAAVKVREAEMRLRRLGCVKHGRTLAEVSSQGG
jgi:hypothetical protein